MLNFVSKSFTQRTFYSIVSGDHHPHMCASFESCSDCEQIFDDDLETFVNLELENGGAIKISRLEINKTCVNTSDVSVTF